MKFANELYIEEVFFSVGGSFLLKSSVIHSP